MLKEPFEILKEKVPFIEYLFRGIKLVVNPSVESTGQLATGEMRFALWDIFLSVSLFTTILGLLTVYKPNTDLVDSLSAFSSQFVLLLEFGYYAYVSTFSFFILTWAFMHLFKVPNLSPLHGAFLASLHYARCYALFLFFFLPIVATYINLLFTDLLSINEFTQIYSGESWIALILFLGFFLWCCVVPIKKFWTPFKNRFLSYMFIALIYYLAFSANTLAPTLGALSLNQENACKLFMKSDKVKSLTKDQQLNFGQLCLNWKHNS